MASESGPVQEQEQLEPIRYAVVGAGMMGVEHILNINALGREAKAAVTAIVDPHKPSVTAALKAVGPEAAKVVKVFSSIEELLATSPADESKGVCDVVVVSTPNMTHAHVLLALLAHPRPHDILVEKPLCTTLSDCKKVLAAAEARSSEMLLQVGLEYRYMPPVARVIAEAKKPIPVSPLKTPRWTTAPTATGAPAAGAAAPDGGGDTAESQKQTEEEGNGREAAEEAKAEGNIGRSDVPKEEESVLGRVRMVAIREHRFPFLVKVKNWNRFNRNSGGTLVEKCCHFFDLMALIAGQKPVRVIASGAQSVNHLDESYDGEVPDILDNAYVIVDYDSGARGCLDLCMFAEGSRNEQEICVVGDRGKVEALVPEGIVRLGRRSEGRAGVVSIQCEDNRVKYEGLHHGSSFIEHIQFLKQVRSARRRRQGKAATRDEGDDDSFTAQAAGLEEGMMAVAVGVAAHKSIDLGRPVSIKEVLEDL